MPVRLRITLLFTLLVFIILGLVSASVYYFSTASRIDLVKNRLINRAITTARLLSETDVFTQQDVQRIDSLTTISLQRKIVLAYNKNNRILYSYSDLKNDSLNISSSILKNARSKGSLYFSSGNKDAIAYHYKDQFSDIVMVVAGEDVEGKSNLKELVGILLLSFIGGTIVAFLSGFIFSRGLLNPIRKIADEVNDISAQNLSRRIATGKVKDDWSYLADTLNKLINRLKDSFELQRRFISNASHELSTPLTSISSQLEVSLQRERDASQYKVVMQSIYQDVKHMSKLTQSLLDFAQASGSTGGLEISLVRIDEVLMRLPAEMAKMNKGYSVSLSFGQLPEEEENLLVFGNEELLFSALKNIVANACKYSDDHHADVNLTSTRNEILVIISDQGQGIPASELENIFQPFYRIEEHRSTTGFGLGLSLARQIIKLHRGHIKVDSKLGHGTKFKIGFPFSKDLQKSEIFQ